MATIVNNPGTTDSGAGWVVAAIVVVAIVLFALFVWPGFGGRSTGSTNVNVSVPALGTQGGAGGATGGQ